MRMIRAVGIDPGMSGAMVLGEICRESTRVLEVRRFAKMDEEGIASTLMGWCDRSEYVFIEKIPKFCGTNLSAAHMGNLFRQTGYLEGIVIGHDVSTLRHLAPLKWMNLVSQDSTRSRVRAERKPQLRDLANRMFPGHKWTLEDCDAILILEAGRRQLVQESLL